MNTEYIEEMFELFSYKMNANDVEKKLTHLNNILPKLPEDLQSETNERIRELIKYRDGKMKNTLPGTENHLYIFIDELLFLYSILLSKKFIANDDELIHKSEQQLISSLYNLVSVDFENSICSIWNKYFNDLLNNKYISIEKNIEWNSKINSIKNIPLIKCKDKEENGIELYNYLKSEQMKTDIATLLDFFNLFMTVFSEIGISGIINPVPDNLNMLFETSYKKIKEQNLDPEDMQHIENRYNKLLNYIKDILKPVTVTFQFSLI